MISKALLALVRGPDCHGVLWKIEDSHPARYRCHTGHAFSIRTLEHTQAAASEEALWSSIRALKEREVTLRRLAENACTDGDSKEAEICTAAADLMERHGKLLGGIVAEP